MAEEVFGFDENTKEGSDFNYIVVDSVDKAIQGDIFYKDFTVGNWDDWQPFLEVTVQNKVGQTSSQRYSLSKPNPNKKNDDPKGKIQAIVKNFATKVLGDKVKFEGKTLQELFEKTITAIKAKPGWDKVNLTAVFVHDDAGYTKLRKFAPIVELTSNKEDIAKLQLAPFEVDSYTKKTPNTPSTESDNLSNGQEQTTDKPQLF